MTGLRTTRRIIWVAAVCVLAVVTASAAAVHGRKATKRPHGAVPPPRTSHRPEPDGRALFATYCASCHGRRGRGDGPDAALFDPPPRDLRTGFLAQRSEAELVRRIRDGGAKQLAIDPAALRSRAVEVEAIAAHVERLPGTNWRLVERGEEIYVDACELCHGPYGRATSSLPAGVRTPRDLSDPAFQRSVDDAELRTLVRHGRRGMPAIPRHWTDEETRALVAFVRLFSPGYERYARYCAACHGDDGRGSGSFAEVGLRPTPVFDRAFFARHDPEQVRAAVWHMLDQKKPTMPHFREQLSESDAQAIVRYLTRAR